jgi:hypothetical protein
LGKYAESIQTISYHRCTRTLASTRVLGRRCVSIEPTKLSLLVLVIPHATTHSVTRHFGE